LTKSLLRTIAKKYVPSGERFWTPKLYVAAPQREWVKGVLRNAIEDMIRDSVLAKQGYLVQDTLLQQFRDYAASPDLGNSFFIWKFMNLELWYRAFCARGDGGPATSELLHSPRGARTA